jgi:hypothetical protein
LVGGDPLARNQVSLLFDNGRGGVRAGRGQSEFEFSLKIGLTSPLARLVQIDRSKVTLDRSKVTLLVSGAGWLV